MNEYSFDEMDCLSDIYCLERMNCDIVKDGVKYNHMIAVGESQEILLEAFADIISKMGEMFKKMVNSIKEFFKKLFMYIASYFMDIDKFVKKYKSKGFSIREDFDGFYFYNEVNKKRSASVGSTRQLTENMIKSIF